MNEVKTANKILKRKLSKDNLVFYKKIHQYIRTHDISREQQHQILNEILTDFVNRQNNDELLMGSIRNPETYTNEILSKYEMGKSSFAMLTLRRFLPLTIIFYCIYFLYPSFFNPFPFSDLDPNLVDVKLQVLVLAIFMFILFLVATVESKEKIFRAGLGSSAKSLIVLIDFILTLIVFDRFKHLIVTSILVPKVVIYLFLGLAILVKFVDRKKVL